MKKPLTEKLSGSSQCEHYSNSLPLHKIPLVLNVRYEHIVLFTANYFNFFFKFKSSLKVYSCRNM